MWIFSHRTVFPSTTRLSSLHQLFNYLRFNYTIHSHPIFKTQATNKRITVFLFLLKKFKSYTPIITITIIIVSKYTHTSARARSSLRYYNVNDVYNSWALKHKQRKVLFSPPCPLPISFLQFLF